MKQNVLLDTGPLVAFVNKRENFHPWALNQWKIINPQPQRKTTSYWQQRQNC